MENLKLLLANEVMAEAGVLRDEALVSFMKVANSTLTLTPGQQGLLQKQWELANPVGRFMPTAAELLKNLNKTPRQDAQV